MSIIKKDFNISLALTVVGGWTNFFTYTVPAKQKLTLTHFSNYMATADWGNVEWRISRNGVPCFSEVERAVDVLA